MVAVAVITPPAAILTLDETKAHLRVVHSDDDAVIKQYMAAAQDEIDGPGGSLGISIGEQTLEATDLEVAHWGKIVLPCMPLLEVASVAMDGTVLDPSTYKVEPDGISVFGFNWRRDWSCVRKRCFTVRYTAGYQAVPARFKQAMLLMVGGFYAARGSKVEQILVDDPAIKRLLSPQKAYSP